MANYQLTNGTHLHWMVAISDLINQGSAVFP